MKPNGKAAIYYWPRKPQVIEHFDQFKYCLGYLLNQVKSIIMTQPITAEVKERVVRQHIAGSNILKGGKAIRTFVHKLLVQRLFQKHTDSYMGLGVRRQEILL